MDRQLEIEVLMQDRCTKAEAEKLLKKGTIVYENPGEWIDTLKVNDCYEGETIEDVRAGNVPDITTVKYKDHEYLIAYCV